MPRPIPTCTGRCAPSVAGCSMFQPSARRATRRRISPTQASPPSTGLAVFSGATSPGERTPTLSYSLALRSPQAPRNSHREISCTGYPLWLDRRLSLSSRLALRSAGMTAVDCMSETGSVGLNRRSRHSASSRRRARSVADALHRSHRRPRPHPSSLQRA